MRIARSKLLTLGACCLFAAMLAPASAQADFGIAQFSASARNLDGSIDLRAGSHPYAYTVFLEMNQDAEGNPEGNLRDFVTDLPAGMAGNPQALPRCSGADFEGQAPHCPGNTQVGVAVAKLAGTNDVATVPVYNLTPALGIPASIGFSLVGANSLQEASLRPGDYGVRISDITIPTEKPIQWVRETIWGVPMDRSHDSERFCFHGDQVSQGCSSEVAPEAFLSLPTSCTGPLQTTMSVDSVQEPGNFVSRTVSSLGEGGTPEGLSGCDRPPFGPTISSQTETTAAESPTGLDFRLHLPQAKLPKGGDPEGIATATAALKDARVELPAGLELNPSTAAGLQACSSAQIELGGGNPPTCPAASQVGTVEVRTPLIDHPLPGTVYIARQGENPFGSLIAIYIVVDDPVSGVVVKLAGKVEPDPSSGQLRTTVEQNPQLPFEDFSFHFFGGPRASFTTPASCGSYTTAADLTPWTFPESPTVHESSSFTVDRAAGGGACAPSVAQLPNSPGFEAGTANPLAGAYSAFVVKLTRANGSQRFGALDITLPQGISGKLAGVPYCPEAQIAAAQARSGLGDGALERAAPSCPAASEVGTVNVGAGSGAPLFVQGHAYLAGPYRGAPLSMVIVTPAIAGPFDLGVVTVRTALYVNDETAQITAKSDPIPTVLHGIPLDVRSIAVQLDRPEFTLNPTSCEVTSVGGSLLSTAGQSAPLSNRFQVGGCAGLAFEPQLALHLKGATRRSGHPALKAVVSFPHKRPEANTASVQVGLPHALFVAQGNLDKVCVQADLHAGTCPSRSIYGHVKAWTPLFEAPLSGPVYLGVGFGYQLPALVADLNGQVRILAHGRVDTTKQNGLRNTFEFVPDGPISRIVLEMKGGKNYGLLEVSENLCAKPQYANARFTAHNGAVVQLRPKIDSGCSQKKKTHHRHH